MEGEKDNSNETTQIENARIGYQVTVNLLTYEGQLIWTRFNAMLVANSIVIAVIGYLITNNSSSIILKYLPIPGIILCILWFLVNVRGFDYYKYWILSAREIEEQFLQNSIKTLSRGGELADCEEINFRINGKIKCHRISKLGKVFKVKTISSFVIIVFIILYVILLFQ